MWERVSEVRELGAEACVGQTLRKTVVTHLGKRPREARLTQFGQPYDRLTVNESLNRCLRHDA